MVKVKEGQTSGANLLRSRKSVGEILEVAMQFELTAYNFYHQLIPKVSKRIRYLVEEMAAEEQEHVRLLSELMAKAEIEQQLKEMVQTPPSDHRFSDAIHSLDLGEKPDDQAILQYALAREQAAMEQYSTLASEVEEGPIQDLFTYLSQQETEHKLELEKIYYETVHRGGV
ncbi:MAG: ferritin family protein [Gammaproteobacteria bacterium]|nr:ferritin family protein [Gammaproteobacteria bacterium]